MKQQIALQRVKFTDAVSDPQNPRILYRTAIRPQSVITGEKFVQNVANHSGQKSGKIVSVLTALPLAVKDYLEAGNAVQIDGFCTLKPRLKVKAVNNPDDCTAETIKSVSLLALPIGQTKELCKKFNFDMTDFISDGSMSDEEGETEQGGENTNPPATEPTPTETVTLTFKNWMNQDTTVEFNVGEQVAGSSKVPTPSHGYEWRPALPATATQNATFREVDPDEEPDFG